MANKSNKIQYVLLIQLIKLVLLHYLWINNVDNAVKKDYKTVYLPFHRLDLHCGLWKEARHSFTLFCLLAIHLEK